MKKFFTIVSCAIFGFFIGCILYLLPNSTIGHVCAPTIYNFNDNEEISTSTKDAIHTLSPYTGEPLTLNELNNIPFLCVIDNSRNSRSQSGLSEADIIYEITLEYGIPKFLALFYKNSPIKIGPIINIYPCFIDISKEYSLPFAHYGCADEAVAIIANDTTIHSINEVSHEQYFWIDTSRMAPSNFYTSSAKIRSFINQSNFLYYKNSALSFNKLKWLDASLETVRDLNLDLSSYYTTSYKFADGIYEKYMDSILATDLNDNTPLTFTNIVIQITNIKSKDYSTDSRIDLIGSGDGLVFSNGKVQKMHWIKSNETSPTILTNLNGEILSLSPGNTIWHIVDITSKISYK